MKKTLFLSIFIILFSLQLFGKTTIKKIYVATDHWEELTNKDGSGLYFDIISLIYSPLGIKVKVYIVPYIRSSLMVENKRADLWLGSYVDEENFALYPKYHFDEDVITAMFKKSKFKNFKGISSLKNKNICWIRGYDIDEYLDVQMKVQERNCYQSLLSSIKKDRCDVYLDDYDDMQKAIKKFNFNNKNYFFRKIKSLKLYPAFRKDSRGEELRAIWDRRMKKFIDNGILKELYKNYDYLKGYLY